MKGWEIVLNGSNIVYGLGIKFEESYYVKDGKDSCQGGGNCFCNFWKFLDDQYCQEYQFEYQIEVVVCYLCVFWCFELFQL